MSRAEVLKLYKMLVRESQKFPSYNFRTYALRRIKDSFKQNKTLDDPFRVEELIVDGKKTFEVIKRQVVIGQMYATDKLVIENIKK